jgi:thiamine biosynthesis lipoprotein
MQVKARSFTPHSDYFCGKFVAMTTSCEVLIESEHADVAQEIAEVIIREALRIEHKFSRYRTDNIIHEINHSGGNQVILDVETQSLLHLVDTCYELSDGLFDITAGVLNKVWSFSPDAIPPSEGAINEMLEYVGWHRVNLRENTITLPEHMAIDLGGIVKEYAVDRCSEICQERWPDISVLINFGGDVAVSNPRHNASFWQVAIPSIDACIDTPRLIQLCKGGMATSGDYKRYLMHNGIRYSHILNPQTGYALTNAPRAVTVCADNCVQAGLLSMMAAFHGPNAQAFLLEQGVAHWVVD